MSVDDVKGGPASDLLGIVIRRLFLDDIGDTRNELLTPPKSNF
jgi:hypothetical protein